MKLNPDNYILNSYYKLVIKVQHVTFQKSNKGNKKWEHVGKLCTKHKTQNSAYLDNCNHSAHLHYSGMNKKKFQLHAFL